MNKKLIQDNMGAFIHWLNGGELLYNSGEMWNEVKNGFRWDTLGPIIINDSYVEFRKALAEGKTVEKCYYHSPDCPRVWRPMEEDFMGMVETYRIKPDEPEFKVGDYAYLTNDTIVQVTSTHLVHGTEHMTLWTLEEASDDEWVLAWFNLCLGPEMNTSPMLMYAQEAKEEKFDNVVPYIGQSPKELGLES